MKSKEEIEHKTLIMKQAIEEEGHGDDDCVNAFYEGWVEALEWVLDKR